MCIWKNQYQQDTISARFEGSSPSILLTQFNSKETMDQNLEKYDLNNYDNNITSPRTMTKTGTTKNKCNQCDFASSQAGNLRAHLKTHSGEKPNKCNQCDYASSHSGHLRTHMKTHSGDKSNKCNQCDYASSQASNLRTHLKTHSGEKPKKCNQCDFASSRAGTLRRHFKTQWRKVKQMRPMWLCIVSGKRFEGSF